MTNEQKLDLKNKFINRLAKRVFDICSGCINKIHCNNEELNNGFILHIVIVFYDRPNLYITLCIDYNYLLADVFNYNLRHFTIKIITEIYDTLYKELDK